LIKQLDLLIIASSFYFQWRSFRNLLEAFGHRYINAQYVLFFVLFLLSSVWLNCRIYHKRIFNDFRQ